MPVKNFTSESDAGTSSALAVMVANVLHAAGVTMALSPRGAELIVAVTMSWFDGKVERATYEADCAAQELRGMRPRRRSRAKAKDGGDNLRMSSESVHRVATADSVIVIKDVDDLRLPVAKSAAKTAPATPSVPSVAMNKVWRVRISARNDAHVSCADVCDAIAAVAADLPQHITSIQVSETTPL